MRAFFTNNWIHIATGAFFALITVSLFAIAMCRGLSRDEHQFIAAGALLATEGLLPYRDFPYFHVPNLIFVYAGLFRCSSFLLLTSRLFSVLCSLALLLIIYLFSTRRLEQLSKSVRFGVSAAITVCAFANPLFRFSCWRAWNHPLPVLLTILAFLCYLKYRTRNSATWLVSTGLLISFAIGSRLTFAPAAFAFLPVLVSCTDPGLHRWRQIGWFCAGLGFGLVPVIIMFSLYPKQFLFGNLTYNAELYPMLCTANGLENQMSIISKLHHVVTHILIQPGNAALVVCLGYFLVRSGAWRQGSNRCSWLLPLLIGSLFLGALAAAIPLPQYFYAPVPLIVVGLAIAIAKTKMSLKADYLVLLLVTIVCFASTANDYRYLTRLFRPDQWATIKVHNLGCQLATLTGKGRIMSLAPILPLEGGLRIYPELTAEPFACRSADFLQPAERIQHKMLTPVDLVDLLTKEPAQGILVTSHSVLDLPLIGFAKAHAYRELPLDLGLTAFLPP
jgi:hypothetical protein